MGSLLDKVEEQEAKQEVIIKEAKEKKSAVNQIITSDTEKDKQISAKVNNKAWDNFTKINKAQGLSNNSALNMILNKYIRENKALLEE